MRILSGIQPSGDLHIGNYFGMMKPMIQYQENHELYCFIVNYHAMTTVKEAEFLSGATISAALDFLSLGLNPNKTIFWIQGDVPEVTELSWILSTITSMGLLERCHSYKDKTSRGIVPNHGLFAYPVLMAADILLYQAHKVPVGADQKQHLEVTRDIAERFNHIYGDIFVIPEEEINSNIMLVPGTDGQKMSKSYNNTIEIFGDTKAIEKKIMRIKTNSIPIEEPKNPDSCNLFALFSLFSNDVERKEMRERYLEGGVGYGEVKKRLVELYNAYFEPYRAKRKELENNLDYVRDILKKGAVKAREKASLTLKKVRDACGLNY